MSAAGKAWRWAAVVAVYIELSSCLYMPEGAAIIKLELLHEWYVH